MLTKVELKRTFVVKRGGKNITVPDPNPNLTLEEVKKFLSISYPEVLNSTLGAPDIKKEVVTYTFTANVASKG